MLPKYLFYLRWTGCELLKSPAIPISPKNCGKKAGELSSNDKTRQIFPVDTWRSRFSVKKCRVPLVFRPFCSKMAGNRKTR
jgi:hypothetical protein